MSDPKFFGYGSLVNLRTHTYANPVPTTLNGWRRVWKPAGDRETSFLSVERDEGGQIDGMIAAVPKGDWGALDAREAAYDRVDVSDQFRETASVAIYQGRPEKNSTTHLNKPISLSYLDVVVQGFHDHFGVAGVERFFASTSGWDRPILNDRVSPVYSRHQTLTGAERTLVDKHLTQLSAVME